MIKSINQFIFLLLTLLSILGCGKDTDQTNTCKGYSRPDPKILIQGDAQIRYKDETGLELTSDTVSLNLNFVITSLLDYDEYNWSIIGDPSFNKHTKSFKIVFGQLMNVDLRFVGKRKVNSKCDPEDDGIDTIMKHIVVVDTTLWYGKYIGYDANNPDAQVGFEIAFEKTRVRNKPHLIIKYFPDSCGDILESGFTAASYNLIEISNHNADGGGSVGCQSPLGWFLFSKEGIDIQYSTKDIVNHGPEIKRRFIGKRVK